MAGRTFPTRDDILAFIEDSPTPVARRDIARAFNIKGPDRAALRDLLRGLEQDGVLDREKRSVRKVNTLPPVGVIVVTEIDEDGETLARPQVWEGEFPPPRIYIAPGRRGYPALAAGDRALARLNRSPADDSYEARLIKRLGVDEAARVVGVFRKRSSGGVLEPADRRRDDGLAIAEAGTGGAQDGDLVVAEVVGRGRGPRGKEAQIIEVLGSASDPRAISLIAIHTAGVPTIFPQAGLDQAEAAMEPTLGDRADLRAVPLVTIDGADARDFDDAVFAEPDGDGWHLIVAIADVAHYVAPDSPLDREARKRGNSCYFPDRVVPMLPEALSNGLCSLVPHQDRACLAAHLWINGQGTLVRHRFERGLMRSHARLTYEQVQSAADGSPDPMVAPLVAAVVTPLYDAFKALSAARTQRGTLDLDLPEPLIRLDDAGRVTSISVRQRLDSHRLIEEFMITANVAAAETLSGRQCPCLFRVHPLPDAARVEALNDFLAPLGYSVRKGQVITPRAFTQILARAADRPEKDVVHQLVLRAQSQAFYGPKNDGHFGLALAQYAHFTSPIRRYADLTVHRALIRTIGLGAGGATDHELTRLDEIGAGISSTERRAIGAERDANDRYMAAYLADQIGARLSGRVSGVTRFGLFVRLTDTGADGLVPISSLPEDFYDHDEATHSLIGRRWGRVYRLGMPVTVDLVEADPLSASTLLRLSKDQDPADIQTGGGDRRDRRSRGLKPARSRPPRKLRQR